MNSVISSGLQGMLQSQHSMQRYAQDIASVNKDKRADTSPSQTSLPPSQSAIDSAKGDGSNALPPNEVPASQKPQVAGNYNSKEKSLEENIVGLRQQEQIFTAAANVVKVGSDAVGSLIDDYS